MAKTFAIVGVLILTSAVLVACNDHHFIELRLVVTEPGHPNPGMVAPKFTSCDDCVTFEVGDATSRGRQRSVFAEKSARVRLESNELSFVELTEDRPLLGPPRTNWVATVVVEGLVARRITEKLLEFGNDQFLVSIDSGPTLVSMVFFTDVVRFPIAFFSTKDELETFAEKISKEFAVPLRWIPFDEQRYEAARRRVDDLLRQEGGSTAVE